MRTLRIVSEHSRVEAGLKSLQIRVQHLSEHDLIELLQHRLVESFADAVSLRTPGLGLRMVDVVDCEIQRVVMSIRSTTVHRTPVGQHPQQRQTVCLEQRQHSVAKQVGRRIAHRS